jgi:hypothetical protein
MTTFQRKIISFVNYLDPNTIPAPKTAPEIHWPAFSNNNQVRMVFQRPDANGTGLHAEIDSVNRTICAFIKSTNLEFLN